MVDIESLGRGFLANTAARHSAVSRAEPEEPSTDYLTRFGAGWEAGQLSAFALALSLMPGEPATTLVQDAQSKAAIDASFPFELHVVGVGEPSEAA